MILRSLVKSADKNLDGSMDWKEFEGFGDFDHEMAKDVEAPSIRPARWDWEHL